MKKKMASLSLFTMLALTSYAQAPNAFQYHSIVTNAQSAVVNTDIGIRFHIRKNSVSGPTVYSESHQVKSNSLGMVSVRIGNGNTAIGEFSSINWSSGVYFIETEIDKGLGFTKMGTHQLLSVPYSKYTNHAGGVTLTSPLGKKFTLIIDEQGDLSTKAIEE